MTEFSLQANAADVESWPDLARKCEVAGFDALLAADHPGVTASPFVALAVAAAVTSTIGLGTYVVNAAIREPILLANDVATLDMLSGGRARLGVGAGHTPAEWAAVGLPYPDVAGRVRRCLGVAEAVRALLGGEEIEVDTPELRAKGALTRPLPVQERIPFTMGGNNSRLLRWAGEHADIVGLSGLGRTLADGHSHEVRWRRAEIERQLEHVAAGAAGRSRPPALEALVQFFQVTDDAAGWIAEHAKGAGLTEAEMLAAPYVLVGTEDEIVSAVREHERRWGITRFVVRVGAMDAVPSIMRELKASSHEG